MFFDRVGKLAIGSRLRFLNERIYDDAAQLYKLYGVSLKPKWWPVYYILSEDQNVSITEIAREIGHSHPSVSNIVREMREAGLVIETKDPTDGRRNLVSLSAKGKKIAAKIADQYEDVDRAVESLLDQTTHNLWLAMEEFEFLLNDKGLIQRVLEQRKSREASKVKIVAYEPKYREAFKVLNEEWIRAYFKMEEKDHRSLEHPKKYILDKGGHILVALYEGKAVGVCALMKMDHPDYDNELAKMGVSPETQGKGIGWILGNAVVEKARELGAEKLYLESNTVLKPAINLYRKLGFKKVAGRPSPYQRANIQMELSL